MNVLGVSGSLRSESSNSRLLTAAARISKPGINIRLPDLVGKLPLFSPDLDPAANEFTQRWNSLVRDADGIIISTPEYARGYPGALKNALDWLVGGDGFVNKPFMFLGASLRASISQTTLTTVLETMSGIHIKEADAIIPLLGTSLQVADIVTNSEFCDTIETSLNRFEIGINERL